LGGVHLKAASFEIPYLQVLGADGKLVSKKAPAIAKDADLLKSLYKHMNLVRAFDAKAYALQRTGKMGTYPASLGQEAIGTAYGHAMKDEDVLVPYYRSTAGQLLHGVKMEEILLYWGGDEEGSNFKDPVAKDDFPICVPIATQYLHAAGIATAIKKRNQKRAVVTEIGEGGTSKGDFYEAINVAGAWNLGVVFFVNNNQWAISVPSEIQTAAETYAQKGIAAGIETIQVDGNDVIALYEATNKAMEKARTGGGATMIEAVTYRLCDHTTADDATRYRSKEEVEDSWTKEPIVRLHTYMMKEGFWSEAEEKAMKEEHAAQIEASVKAYEEAPKPTPESMFDYLFETLPEQTVPQREAAIRRGAK
jgi:2-oxoisovalerate dehydrogenase E1 component alpha subunit